MSKISIHNMYSVISVGGHQYKVHPGVSLVVDKLTDPVDSTISFPSLLYVNEKTVKVGKEAAVYQVSAKVMKHFQGKKVDVERFRAKSRHRRHIGFRHQLTEIKIEQIGGETKKGTPQTSASKQIRKPSAKKT
jgi:large subunit ribosomal protein L21